MKNIKTFKAFEELSPEIIQKARSVASSKNRNLQQGRFEKQIVQSVIGKEVFNCKIDSAKIYGSTDKPNAYIKLISDRTSGLNNPMTHPVYVTVGGNKGKVTEVYLFKPADEQDHYGTFKFKVEDGNETELYPSNEVIIRRQDAMKLISIFSIIIKGCEFKLENNPRKYFKIEEDN